MFCQDLLKITQSGQNERVSRASQIQKELKGYFVEKNLFTFYKMKRFRVFARRCRGRRARNRLSTKPSPHQFKSARYLPKDPFTRTSSQWPGADFI